MSDKMPDRMPEDMSDRMPEDMSEYMSEIFPIRKYINIMVGIIWNKPILLFVLVFINQLPN